MKVKWFCFSFVIYFFISFECGAKTANWFIPKFYTYLLSGTQVDCNNEVVLYSEKTETENSPWSFDGIKGGTKILFPFADLRYFATTLSGADFVNTTEEWKNFKNMNLGLCFTTEKLLREFPCFVKFGNLTAGGSLSFLNNPVFSESFSALGQVKARTSILSASLPSYSYYSKPLSWFLQAGYFNKSGIFQKVTFNSWYSENQDSYAGSLFLGFLFFNKVNLELAATTGIFPFDENYSNSWFLKTKKYYHSGNHSCTNLEIAAYNKILNSFFAVNLYESPFGNLDYLLKTENKIKAGHSTFNFSALYIPNETITAAQNLTEPTLQFKAGYQNQNTFILGIPNFYKTGFTILTDTNLNDFTNKINLKTGFQLTNIFTTLSIYAGTQALMSYQDNFLQFSFTNYTVELKNLWNYFKIVPTLSAAVKITPKNENNLQNETSLPQTVITQKYSADIVLCNKPKISSTNSFSATISNNQLTKWKETSSINVCFTAGLFTCLFKLSIVFFADS